MYDIVHLRSCLYYRNKIEKHHFCPGGMYYIKNKYVVSYEFACGLMYDIRLNIER